MTFEMMTYQTRKGYWRTRLTFSEMEIGTDTSQEGVPKQRKVTLRPPDSDAPDAEVDGYDSPLRATHMAGVVVESYLAGTIKFIDDKRMKVVFA